ncbi:GNAT family N-acetyltransferase [Hymenobacter norwichensis]|uniref:GNAT family N-acetyltransferase n=1 Tax=Hymenobacter norwichensis TaxID=223903 RepID=UPI0003B45941|nr:GNAT family N-acetyltransferase [Hymenobacter norwichensis]
MLFREATLADIPALFEVRYAVTENVLRNRALVTAENTADYLTRRGKGWLCKVAGQVVGFAIVDLEGHSIWALFVRPEFVGHSIGKQLHHLMLAWYFAQTSQTVSLSTAPGTRAEEFYRRHGWQETGHSSSGEVRFEMIAEEWESHLNSV